MSQIKVADYGAITNTEVYGLAESIRRAKYPMATDIQTTTSSVTPGVVALAQSGTGEGHDNWLNGVLVQFDLTYTIKAWVEAERYHFLDFVSSQSTMHCIAKFDLSNQYDKYTDPRCIEIVEELVAEYNRLRDGARVPGLDEPSARALRHRADEAYLRLLMSNPCGFQLTAGMTTNYRQLKTIYKQRRNHRLPEWREFCCWIETLPMAELITGGGKDGDA